ncbi:MAG: response regulator [Planctomycetota bacterium]
MTAKRRILVVDDEPDVAAYIAAALEDQGYETAVAAGAAEGLALVRASHPDLLCLDLVMPGLSGLSFYHEMRSTPELAGIPVVVVSGLSSKDAGAKLFLGDKLPAPEAFIEKPIDIGELLKAVRAVLRTRGGEHE